MQSLTQNWSWWIKGYSHSPLSTQSSKLHWQCTPARCLHQEYSLATASPFEERPATPMPESFMSGNNPIKIHITKTKALTL